MISFCTRPAPRNQNTVAQQHGLVDVVRHEQHRLFRAIMYRKEFDLKRFARLRIERRKGFVQEQNLRVDGKGAGDAYRCFIPPES